MLANLKNCESGQDMPIAEGVRIGPIVTGAAGGSGKRSLPVFSSTYGQLTARPRASDTRETANPRRERGKQQDKVTIYQ